MRAKYLLRLISFKILIFLVLFLYGCASSNKPLGTLNQKKVRASPSYQAKFKDKDLGEFLVDAEKYINIAEVRKLFDKIKAEME